MTRSHKLLVLLPPLLIGLTVMMMFFFWQHNVNQQAQPTTIEPADGMDEFIITEPVPEPPRSQPLPANRPPATNTDPVFCTMDVKECPNGSFVGREGPNCEFKECPTEYTATPSDAIPESRQPNTVENCPMDAMMCPDGSSVGREGPNCEFRKCPGNTEETSLQVN